jgi:hypothetical protein
MFIAIQSNSNVTGKRIGTLNDIEIEISTSQDIFVLGETFTATVFLVNNDSYDIWIKALHSYMIDANSLNDPNPVIGLVDVTFSKKNPLIHIPANSSVKFEEIQCSSQYTGEFQIICIGGKKTVLILEEDIAWIKAFILTGEPSSNLEIVELSSEDENVARSLFEVIDKVLPDDESVVEGVPIDSAWGVHLYGISIAEADSIIHYFGDEVVEGRDIYEFYVNFVDYVFSIYIQLSRPSPTS